MRITVIGSGFGGLASAVRLQNDGHEVTLLEKRDKPGGRAYVYEIDGFRFDGGPTVITAPWLFEELFREAGRNPEDYYKLVPLDPFYKVYFHDGTSFHYNGDQENILKEIRKFEPADVEGYLKFIGTTEDIFRTGFGLIDKPFHKLSAMMKILPDLVRLKSHQSVYKYVSGYIRNEKLRQVFSFHPLLIGGNPFQTTNIYTLIHFLEKKWGVWYAMGGTGSIINALVRLFTELGGKIQYGSEVDELLIENARRPRVSGVRLRDGVTIKADAVVCNAEIATAYKNLVNPKYRKKNTDKKLDAMKHSMSLFVIYFGTKVRYDSIPHHSIILGRRYKELLDDIFKNHRLSDDFSLYLHRPSGTDPSIAPDGCDLFYVLSPVPNLKSGTDWKKQWKPYRDSIMNFLNDNYLPGLHENLAAEHHIDPIHFRDELNSHLGSAFSVEPILMQSAYMRPHNKSEDIDGLYFAGAGTHPGAGLPGVVSSAKIVQQLVREDSRSRS